MYDARKIAEGLRDKIVEQAEQGEWPLVPGEVHEDGDGIVILDAEPLIHIGRSGEAEAAFLVRTSDGRYWRIGVDEVFI